MSEITDQLADIETKVVELVEQIQKPLIEGVRTTTEWADSVLPTVNVPYLGTVGSLEDWVGLGFGVIDDIVANQKAFIENLLDATAPVRAKLVDADITPVTPMKPAATKKAA